MKPTLSIKIVAGVVPNFMKIAPIGRALQSRKAGAADSGVDLCVSIIHYGQHIYEKYLRSYLGSLRSRSRTITRFNNVRSCQGITDLKEIHKRY
ncbi:MAG: hypothetical protein A2W25_09340 [candidate division Zixibacteria bacterium RBG_16_53_22]|nr:MAG: hypothetical protein A2W25_09340 [candidate division Zixibacteria bacterium RBG_16_53_22]